MQKIILILLPILVIALTLFFLFRAKILPFNSRPTTPIINISGSTLPAPNLASLPISASRFQGKIEKIEGQTLIVKGQPLLDFTLSATDSAKQSIPTLTLKINISADTQIMTPQSTASGSGSVKPTIQDLKVGQTITVISPADLRKLKTAEFTARLIQIHSIPIIAIIGQITEIKGDSLTISLLNPVAPAINGQPNFKLAPADPAKFYQVIMTNDTKIFNDNSQKPLPLTRQDLKVNREILVFTQDDPGSQTQITALRINLALK